MKEVEAMLVTHLEPFVDSLTELINKFIERNKIAYNKDVEQLFKNMSIFDKEIITEINFSETALLNIILSCIDSIRINIVEDK